MIKSDIYGSHQVVHIGEFACDRYLIRSGVIDVEVTESFSSVSTAALRLSAAPDSGFSIPCVSVQRRYNFQKGMATYSYSYEGVPPGEDLENNPTGTYCALEGSDREEPVATHPSWVAIAKKYSALSPGGVFDHFAPNATIDGVSVPNPLFGCTHYMTVGMVWSRTYARYTIPSNCFDAVDSIDDPVGNNFMTPPDLSWPRNWLKMAPTFTQRGNVIQITDKWMASGKNGWNPDLYSGKNAMTGQNGGGNGTLTGGGLSGGTLSGGTVQTGFFGQ